MNKMELVKSMATKAEITQKDAEKALVAFQEVVTETLMAGEKISLVGFGNFEVVERDARECRNPKTGESVSVPAKKAPKFKFSKIIKDALK